MRYYSPEEISKINGNSLATNGTRYYCTNNKIYQGQYNKKLKLYIDPEIKGSSVVYEITGQNPFTVTENLDILNESNNIVNGNKEFTYDINNNLTQIKTYSDSLLLNLISTKNLTYDVSGNLITLENITTTTTITSTFEYSINGDLISKTIN